jgi:XTP/dITP diphosphohydrolase/tetrapyrrole methylase family protein/MazG family protein
MLAEAVWKQIEKKSLPAETAVDTAKIKALGTLLDGPTLGRLLFELAAAARAKNLDPEGALRLHTAKVMRTVEEKAGAGATA